MNLFYVLILSEYHQMSKRLYTSICWDQCHLKITTFTEKKGMKYSLVNCTTYYPYSPVDVHFTTATRVDKYLNN